jgi:hypothetical protein
VKGEIKMEANDVFSNLYPYNGDEEPNTQAALNDSAFPPQTPVGMAYVPMQKIGVIFQPDAAFKAGTVFPDLEKPFMPRGVMSNE